MNDTKKPGTGPPPGELPPEEDPTAETEVDNRPPSVSFEDAAEMFRVAFNKATADYVSPDHEFNGAGEQVIHDDDHLSDD